MKWFITVCLFALATAAAAAPTESDPNKYDTSDIEAILENRRLLIPYIKCALEEGKCSAEAKALRDNLKEALKTACEKCTEQQKSAGGIIFKHLINNEKEYWNQLVGKYDPEKVYAPAFEKEYLIQ